MARQSSNLKKAHDAFDILRENWSKEQACGIISNIEAESNFREDAIGDGGTAYGICQWHSDRQRNFRNHFGHDIRSSTYVEQVQFINVELVGGTESHAGELLKRATSPNEAGRLVSQNYERPADGSGSVARHRAERADDWFALL